MSPQAQKENALPVFWTNWKVRALGLAGFALASVSAVSAAVNFNGTEVVIYQVTLLFTPLLNVIVSAVPLIVTLAIIGFILGILAAILSKLNL